MIIAQDSEQIHRILSSLHPVERLALPIMSELTIDQQKFCISG